MNAEEKNVNLSSIRLGEAGIYKGNKFIVIYRVPEDICSGFSEILYENGQTERFVWDDNNPKVVFIGSGKIKMSFE